MEKILDELCLTSGGFSQLVWLRFAENAEFLSSKSPKVGCYDDEIYRLALWKIVERESTDTTQKRQLLRVVRGRIHHSNLHLRAERSKRFWTNYVSHLVDLVSWFG